jgi:hypothetical protein
MLDEGQNVNRIAIKTVIKSFFIILDSASFGRFYRICVGTDTGSYKNLRITGGTAMTSL